MSFYRIGDRLVEDPISIEVWDINGKKPEAFLHDIDNVELTFGMWSEGFLSFDCAFDSASKKIGHFYHSKILVVWYDRYCQLMIPSSFEQYFDKSNGSRAKFTAFGTGTLLERLVTTVTFSGDIPERGGNWKNKLFKSPEELQNVQIGGYCEQAIEDAINLVDLTSWFYGTNTAQVALLRGQVIFDYEPLSVNLYKTFAYNLQEDNFPIFIQPTAVIPTNAGLHTQPNYFEYECNNPGFEFEVKIPQERSDIFIDLSADNIASYNIKRMIPASPMLAIGRGHYKSDNPEDPDGYLYRSNMYQGYNVNPFFRSSTYTDEKDVSKYVSYEQGLYWEIHDAAEYPRKEIQVDVKLVDSSNILLDYRKSEGGNPVYKGSVDIGDKIPVVLPDGTTVKLVVVAATISMNASTLSTSFKFANSYAPESMMGDGAQLLQLPR